MERRDSGSSKYWVGELPQNPSSGEVVGPVGGMREPQVLTLEPTTRSSMMDGKEDTTGVQTMNEYELGGCMTTSGGAGSNQPKLDEMTSVLEDGNLMLNTKECHGSGFGCE